MSLSTKSIEHPSVPKSVIEKNVIDMTDEAIALSVQKGNVKFFAVLVDRYEPKLMRYGRKFLHRLEDIEDIVQEVFIKVFRSINSFNPSFKFNSWIYRIAHNSFVNALRKGVFISFDSFDLDTFLGHEVIDESMETEREMREVRELLEQGIGILKPKYSEVLILHYYEDLPYKDIADILQVPIGTVSVRVKRAKEMLRRHLEKEGRENETRGERHSRSRMENSGGENAKK